MEFIDYWQILRRWFVLIVGGTVLAAGLSYGVLHLRERAATPTYRSTTNVLVHYVLPFGAPNNPTISPQIETIALKRRATDPSTLAAVARSTHVSLRQITGVTALADSPSMLITLRVDGRTAAVTQAFAKGLATYLANLQGEQVQSEIQALQHNLAGRVATARDAWLIALTHYNLVRAQSPANPSAQDRATQARLAAMLEILQQDYQSLSGQYQVLALAPLPAATVEDGQDSTVAAPTTSLVRALLPLIALSLLLLIGLAAILESVRARSHSRT